VENAKRKTRERLLSALRELTGKEIIAKSNKIFYNLITLDIFKNSKKIHCYVSHGWEAKTHELIREIIKQKGFAVIPFIENDRMQQSKITSFENLVPGKFGIPEPAEKIPVPIDQTDLAVIPGVAFDEKGNRIGRGKGYYDKFLKEFAGKKLALAYDFQIAKSIENEKHDVKMDYIITEERIIKCRTN